MPRFIWDNNTKWFKWKKNGRQVAKKRVEEVRAEFLREQGYKADDLTKLLFEKKITIDQWYKKSRDLIRQTYNPVYALGKGGKNRMTPADRGLIGSLLKKQYQFLNRFAVDLADGRYTPEQVFLASYRLRLYINSSTQAFEAGKSNAQIAGMYKKLPAMPGDGTTICRANCKCSWSFKKAGNGIWLASWILHPAEHCDTCTRRAQIWKNLRVEIVG